MSTTAIDPSSSRTLDPSASFGPAAEPHLHAINETDLPAGKVFEIDSELAYDLGGDCEFLFNIHAMNGPRQQLISESVEISPALPSRTFEDPTAHHRFLRLSAGAGPLSVRYRARVRRLPEIDATGATEVPIAQLPDEVMHNLMATRYCESDELSRFAQKLFGQHPMGHARVAAISDWIHDNIDYQIGSTCATTTSRDVLLQRAGVCRDFAHLGITFCRALNIPARLVVGYATFDEPPPDFHAVFEAWLSCGWVAFDPTKMSPLDELVRTGVGRDAKDVAFATIFGPAMMTRMNPCISSSP